MKKKDKEIVRLKTRVNDERDKRNSLSLTIAKLAWAHSLALKAERRFITALADAGSKILPCQEERLGNEIVVDEDSD